MNRVKYEVRTSQVVAEFMMMYCGDKHNELYEQRTAPARRTKHTHTSLAPVLHRGGAVAPTEHPHAPAFGAVDQAHAGERVELRDVHLHAKGGGRCMRGAAVRQGRAGGAVDG